MAQTKKKNRRKVRRKFTKGSHIYNEEAGRWFPHAPHDGGGGGDTTNPSEPIGDPAKDLTPPTPMTPPTGAKVELLGKVPGITDPSEVVTLGPGQATVKTDFTGGPSIQGFPTPPTAQAFTGQAKTAGDAETAAAPTTIPAARYDAFTIAPEDVPTVQAAQGELSEGAIARVDEKELTERALAAERDMAQEQAALTKQAAQYEISNGAYVDKVTGAVTDVAPTKEAEVAQREAIIGKAAQDAEAAQILETLNYEAAQVRTVKGTAAKGAAAQMVAEVGELPPELSATIVEDPATVEAQIDNEPV